MIVSRTFVGGKGRSNRENCENRIRYRQVVKVTEKPSSYTILSVLRPDLMRLVQNHGEWQEPRPIPSRG